MQSLSERIQPQSLDEVVGQNKVVKQLRLLEERCGFAGRAIWLSGLSGTGKTTLARIITRKIAGLEHITEIEGIHLTSDVLSKWENACASQAKIGKGVALIINTVHGIRDRIVRRLLANIEKLPPLACLLFTTTKDGQQCFVHEQVDAGPLMSRCMHFELDSSGPVMELAFASHLLRVARAENCAGKPLAEYVALIRRAGGIGRRTAPLRHVR